MSRVEQTLRLAEALSLEDELVHALNSKALLLLFEGRWVEARLLLEGALARSRSAELHERWLGTANNLGLLHEYSDRFAEVLALSGDMAALARQRGDRDILATARTGDVPALVELGRWEEALARAAEADQLQGSATSVCEAIFGVPVLCERGDVDAASALLASREWMRDSKSSELVAGFAAMEARLLRARNRPAEALAAAERALACRAELGIASRKTKLALVEALEAALELDDLGKADELLSMLDALQPGHLTPVLAGERARFHARIGVHRGQDDFVDDDFRAAARVFGEHSLVFRQAVTLLEHAEWLVRRERAAEARLLLDQARETFEQLGARPWLERLAASDATALAPAH
jgi:tetratricopeptide (TPR) repeat protein